MGEQLSIFDIFSGDVTGGFCFDQDINHITSCVDAVLESLGITKTSRTFEIWEHVPHLGYRLHDSAYVPESQIDDFVKQLQSVIEYGEKHGVEVSLLTGGAFGNDNKAHFHIMTMFTDKRQKLKAKDGRKELYAA